MTPLASVEFKRTRFYAWLQGRVKRFMDKYFDHTTKGFKNTASADVFRREEEELTARAPLKMLKLFGVTDNLTTLLW
jgi:hypothetical protein